MPSQILLEPHGPLQIGRACPADIKNYQLPLALWDTLQAQLNVTI